MDNTSRPDASTASRLLRDYFFSRTDIVAARQSWIDRKTKERISQPRPVTGDAHLDSLIAFHVAGPDPSKAPALNYINRRTNGLVADKRGFDRVGSYAVAPDNTTAWLCLDFDGPSHPLPLADPLATMLACVEKCRAAGIPAHIEKSGSGHGWHLWVFFEAPVPAVDARLLGYSIAPTGHVLVTGEAADVRIGRGIECFPKQNTVSDKKIGAGNMVWLPFWYGAKDGGNQFYQIADGGLAPFAPDDFERLLTARLHEILAQVPDAIRRFVLKTKGGLKTPSAPKSSPPATPGNYAPTDTQMIQAALDHISPDVSYDDWLRIGMALHHWDASAGFSLWDAWSARGDKYVPDEPSIKWDGFTSGGGVTLGTLFDMAKKAGWEPPVHQRTPLPTDEEMAAFMDIDPSALLAQVQSDKRREIIECLLKAGRPLSPGEVAAETGRTINSAQKILFKMAQDGLIERLNHGTYKAVSCKQPDEKAVSKAECEAVFPKQPSSEAESKAVSPKQPSSEAESKAVSPKQPTQTALQTDSAKAVSLKQPSETAFSTHDADGPRLPTVIVNNRHFRHIRDEAWAAVHASNYPPRLFQRTGSPVCLTVIKGVPEITPVDSTIMFDHLCSIASWVRHTPEMETPTNPPKELPMVMVKRPHPALPSLESIATTPIFDQNGGLVQAPGYHRETRLWIHRPPGFDVGDIPANPTPHQIDEARSLLCDELLVDFPFTSDSDRCHAMAALFPIFVRRMIDGPLPIHLVEAPTPGTGKSLLAEAISLVCVGHSADVTTFDKDENDTRKKITAILASAPHIVLVDNLRKGLLSSQIAAAITANIWTDRLLQTSQMLHLPNLAMWIATANNPALSMENARRSIRVRLDAKMDRPGQRRGFKHYPLRQWILDNRPTLVRAILTLVRGWVTAGMPGTDQVLGSFESWSQVVGGILQWCGVPGFLANTDELMESADSEGNEWREFVSAWWDKFDDSWVIATQLLELALADDYLPSALGDKSARSQKTRLGIALQSMRDRQFAQWRIVVRRATRGHRAEYRLAQVNCGEFGGDPGSEVLSLFGRPSPRSTVGLPQGLPNISKQNQQDADVVDVGRPLSGLNTCEEDESIKYAHAHIGPQEKVYQGIKVYHPVENKEENHGRPLVDVESRSTNPPTGDLADFNEDMEKKS